MNSVLANPTAPAARPINLIAIHCSGTENGVPVSVQTVDRMHRERKPPFRRDPRWCARQNADLTAIGYHFVVYINGALATGRHLDEQGAHVAGHNINSLGICMIGTDHFTRWQWEMLKANVLAMKKRYPGARVCGHRDLSPDIDGDGTIEMREWIKICPGFNVADWLAGNMEPLAGHILETPSVRA